MLLVRPPGGDEPAAVVQAEAELLALGVAVTVATCDLTDVAALAELRDQLPEDRPLTAVVHARRGVDDRPVDALDASAAAAVLDHDAAVALALHELTARPDEDGRRPRCTCCRPPPRAGRRGPGGRPRLGRLLRGAGVPAPRRRTARQRDHRRPVDRRRRGRRGRPGAHGRPSGPAAAGGRGPTPGRRPRRARAHRGGRGLGPADGAARRLRRRSRLVAAPTAGGGAPPLRPGRGRGDAESAGRRRRCPWTRRRCGGCWPSPRPRTASGCCSTWCASAPRRSWTGTPRRASARRSSSRTWASPRSPRSSCATS
ncbi:KR domain-containing protein [Streptomyces sp. M19]